jgi:lipopolysaccharide transport system ATP-binding protein
MYWLFRFSKAALPVLTLSHSAEPAITEFQGWGVTDTALSKSDIAVNVHRRNGEKTYVAPETHSIPNRPQTPAGLGDVAISLVNIGKQFKIYGTGSDRLKELLHPLRKAYHQGFWALNDISFDVKRGESVGIIGRNGSGKSTLLKIICSILEPTLGDITVNGRLSALLELGAGFDAELTGRENVTMNAALMGYTGVEIKERFERIADFAEIGDFMDQPVKFYSSGMYVRLAFSVAVHVDPDILIVDEALAVGDEAFQSKCFSRIREIQERGGTIVMVSHDPDIVVDLCHWAILLDQGKILVSGHPNGVISHYHKFLSSPPQMLDDLRKEMKALPRLDRDFPPSGEPLAKDPATNQANEGPDHAFYDENLQPQQTLPYESHGAVIENPRIATMDGEIVNCLLFGQAYQYVYDVIFREPANTVRFGMMIKTVTGFELGGHVSHETGRGIDRMEKGTVVQPKFHFRCLLSPGTYFINAGVLGRVEGAEMFLHRLIDSVIFKVLPEEGFTGTGFVDFELTFMGCDVIKETPGYDDQ